MIRLMAAASARNLHEAQLACIVHAHENLHREHAPQEPYPNTIKGAASAFFLRIFPRTAAPFSRRRALLVPRVVHGVRGVRPRLDAFA